MSAQARVLLVFALGYFVSYSYRGVNLVLSAATPAIELYDGARLRAQFARTESRLIEMQSEDYLAREHRP